MRIPVLLQKIADLASQPDSRSAIDVDLMLDYTRVLYADLLEWRAKLPVAPPSAPKAAPALPADAPVAPPPPASLPVPPPEPTLDELAAAMQEDEPEEFTDQAATPAPTTAAFSAGDAPAIGATQGADIRSLIGINDKYQIMSELFGNDKNAYEQALDFINQSGSERKALDWLREQLWITEERSEAAQSFFELVERFFNRR